MPDWLTFPLLVAFPIVAFLTIKAIGAFIDELSRSLLAGFAPEISSAVAGLIVRAIVLGTKTDVRGLIDEIAAIIDGEFASRTTGSERVLGMVTVIREAVKMATHAREVRSAVRLEELLRKQQRAELPEPRNGLREVRISNPTGYVRVGKLSSVWADIHDIIADIAQDEEFVEAQLSRSHAASHTRFVAGGYEFEAVWIAQERGYSVDVTVLRPDGSDLT